MSIELFTAPFTADPACGLADLYLVELLPPLALLATQRCDDAFEFGLDVLIRGLGVMRPSMR